MKVNVEKQPKSTVKITITVEAEKVKQAYNKVVDKLIVETEIEGFRKGNAPKDKVINKVGENNIKSEVINDVLQTYYPQALKENMIAPVSNPKVEVKEFDIEKDMEFSAIVAVRPPIKVGDYKKALTKMLEDKKEGFKKANEEKVKKGEKIDDVHVHLSPSDVIPVLADISEVEISDMLVNDETDRMMARLVDQAQTIGMSLEQYLKAQNKTSEQLRAEYSKTAERSLKSEFVMGELVKERKVDVSDKEIEDTMVAAGYGDLEKRMQDPMEKMYVKSILQKNKLISDIIAEVEGDGGHEHEQK